MIYFDNAATTLMKPPSVAEAVVRALESFGGPARGVHEASIASSLAVDEARATIARLLGAQSAGRVAFGCNATDALNAAIEGLLPPGSHAITTAASHNSVLRPLYRKVDRDGASLSIAPIAPDGSLDIKTYEKLFRPETVLVVATHASNVTGNVYDVRRMARIAHDHGALFVLDAAQTAGAIPIHLQEDGFDAVAFTGHKSLFGPQGTGGIALSSALEIPSYRVGGSGTHSYDRVHPSFMPERLEAGTLNAHGLAGLAAGAAYLEEAGIEAVGARVRSLARRFEEAVSRIDGVCVYGGSPDAARCGIVALNVGRADSALVADRLNADFGICTRAGAHCAPLMHEALGTSDRGVVRFSFSHFNTEEEIDEGVGALEEIARELA